MEEEKAEEQEGEQTFNREEREQTSNTYNDSVFKNVFRSKGMLYVATQTDSIFTWQTAGIMCEVKHLGKWLGSGTKQELYDKGHQEEYDSWKDKVQGDRKTQLVIIGSGVEKDAITKALDDCLVSVEQYKEMKKEDRIENMVVENEEEDHFRPV